MAKFSYAWMIGASCLCAATPGVAQRAGENALRSAEDAFGSSVGNESIGLYSPYSVRGFSPFAAGNVRLEGLYYDAAVGFNGRLIRGSTVRVGISAQGYPFPAPTGIADFRLRMPGDEASLSIVAGGNSWGGTYTQLDGQLPLIGDKLTLGAGAHLSDDRYHFDGGGVHSSAAVILRFRPTDRIEIIPFWSGFRHHGMDNHGIIVPAGSFLPPKMKRGRYFSQDWAKYKGEDSNRGVIARWRAGTIDISGGLFRSVAMTENTYTELFTDVSEEGVAAHHLVSAAPPQKYASTSGELRASRTLLEGDRLHTLMVVGRARNRTRRYGGDDLADLGPVHIDEPADVAKPDFTFGDYTRNTIRQKSIGLGYQGRWKGLGELTLGIQKVDYRKDITRPDQSDPPTKARPWLYNAGIAVTPFSNVAVYAGYARGLEESPVAPTYALNRDEAPPAILTRQYDGGVRWSVTKDVKLVAGLFNVEKPYFSLDPNRIYRQLGEVRHRGAELSLVGQIGPRLSLVAGAILLDATVSGEQVESGEVGKRPVGSVPRNLLVSVDYQLPINGLSIDATVNHLGKQPANSANSLFVPATETVDLGVRYATKVGGRPVSFRAQVANLLNAYSWDILGSNAYFYSAQRQFSVRLTTDL